MFNAITVIKYINLITCQSLPIQQKARRVQCPLIPAQCKFACFQSAAAKSIKIVNDFCCWKVTL